MAFSDLEKRKHKNSLKKHNAGGRANIEQKPLTEPRQVNLWPALNPLTHPQNCLTRHATKRPIL